MAFMITKTGKKFNPFAPADDRIDLEDIAHALSHVCRFAGHTREFYSVAEHSVRVSQRVGQLLGTDISLESKAEYMLLALLHDATEAYLPDLVRPFKARFGIKDEMLNEYVNFKMYEDNLLRCIHSHFGLPGARNSMSMEIIERADLELLVTEARDLVPDCEWCKDIPAQPLPAKINPVTPGHAKLLFLEAFKSYQSGFRH